jgi:7-dehydrocholesterol reductase
MALSVSLQLFYIAKFFYWETGYLRSIDIMHDRAGFYICWGCLVWVPCVYTSVGLYLVHHPYHFAWWLFTVLLVTGIACILINFLADRQRQMVRHTHGKCTIWGKKPALLSARYTTTSGEERENLLLVSGWWGIARHFHYVPEILGAFFWTVPALFTNVLPYFYVVFLTFLLLDRALRDEKRCAKKYGEDWDIYCEKVPYKMIPKVF